MAAACRQVPFQAKVLFQPAVFRSIRRFKHTSITGNARADQALQTVTGGRVDRWLGIYEHRVGLAEVRAAQDRVMQAERDFLGVQEQRRSKQNEIREVDHELRRITAELEKTARGEEKYLLLLTQEHAILQSEKQLRDEHEALEREEKAKFGVLSSALRESHEKERLRSERVKYWSIIGSIIGAAIGIIGTSINNYLRMRELRGIVTDSAEGGHELRVLVSQLSDAMTTQHNQVRGFVADLRAMVGGRGRKGEPPAAGGDGAGVGSEKPLQLLPLAGSFRQEGSNSDSDDQLQKQTKEILDIIQKQEKKIDDEMKSIKEIVSVSRATDSQGNVVYVGPEIKELLDETERNIETRLKMNALWTVVFIYGGLALTVPVIYNLFK